MKINLWELDATKYTPKDKYVDYIVKSIDVDNFLSKDFDGNERILVGPKGVGKSLILRTKSWRDSNNGKINVHGDLTNFIGFISKFDANSLNNFVNEGDWSNIFQASILYYITISRRGILKDSISYKVFGDVTLLRNLVEFCIVNRKNIRMLAEVISEQFEILSKIDEPLVLYIDDIDQALYDALTQKEYYSFKNYVSTTDVPIASKIWINAQIGLMRAIFNINKVFRHIQIYSTIREEAFDFYYYEQQNMNLPQLENICIQLRYKKEDLIQIINNYVKSYGHNGKYWGYFNTEERLRHFKVHSSDEKYDTENLSDLIIRHTFNRPREVVRHLNALRKLTSQESFNKLNQNSKDERIRQEIHLIGRKNLQNLTNEILPFFPKNEFEILINRYNSNMIKKSDIQEDDLIMFELFYNLGIVGIVKNNNGEKVQYFERVKNYFAKPSSKLPLTEYFLFHPTTDQYFMDKNNTFDFYYKECIIGHLYPFKEPGNMGKYIPAIINRQKKSEIDIIKKHYEYFYNSQNTNVIEAKKEIKRNVERKINLIIKISFIKFLQSHIFSKKLPEYYNLKEHQYCNQLEKPKLLYNFKSTVTKDNISPNFSGNIETRLIILICIINNVCNLNLIESKLLKLTTSTNYTQQRFFIHGLKKNVNYENLLNGISAYEKIQVTNYKEIFEKIIQKSPDWIREEDLHFFKEFCREKFL